MCICMYMYMCVCMYDVAETFRSGSKSLHGSGAGKKRTRSKVSSVVGGGSSGVGSSSSTATTSSTSAIGSSSIASGGAVDVTDKCEGIIGRVAPFTRMFRNTFPMRDN